MQSGTVLVIDNYDSFTYNLIQLLEEIPGCLYEVVRNDQIPFASLGEFRKVLISPGPGHPSEFHTVHTVIQQIGPTADILGVCLGHQIIARFFGGQLANLPVVSHGIKKSIQISHPRDILFDTLPKQFDAGLYHSWIVVDDQFPNSLRVTARSIDGQIMAIAHRQYHIRGMQFHPESILTHFGRTMIQNWLRFVPSSRDGLKKDR